MKRLEDNKPSKTDSDMVDLWQHYLWYHQGEHINAHCKYIDTNSCHFIKHKLEQRSWNLMQTMHVYFYHNDEYKKSSKNDSRRDRFVRPRNKYRIRQNVPLKRIRTSAGTKSLLTTANSASDCSTPSNSPSLMLRNSDSPGSASTLLESVDVQTDIMANIELENVNEEQPGMARISSLQTGPGFEILISPNQDADDDDEKENLTKLGRSKKYEIEYQSTTEHSSLKVLEFGQPFVVEKKDAKFKNPKDEMLKNSFKGLSKVQWNDLMRVCVQYAQHKNAKWMKLTIKEIIGLKMYTDFDDLQREYRKCYRDKQDDAYQRQREFYHWNALLLDAVSKSKDIITKPLYHGVDDSFSVPTYSGTYYGPISTTTKFIVSKQFAGSKGRIFELYPTFGRRGMRMSWLSNYPDEEEVLYMNTSFQIANVYKGDHLMDIPSNGKKKFSQNAMNGSSLFEKSILKALHVMNIESNIISFSNVEDTPIDDDLCFYQLDESEQIAILYLLYLQYSKDWKSFWKQQDEYKRIAFAKYRDQFIVLG